MVETRHLNNAPIKEALIDIRVLSQDDLSVDSLDSHYSEFSAQYPRRKTIKQGMFGFNFGDDAFTTNVSQDEIGFRYTSEDERQIVQFRQDGFTFSRLEPYGTWEEIRDEGRRLWDIYTVSANPKEVVRVATRYINEMQIPMPIKSFSDYLTCPPTLPEGVPQALTTFLTRAETYYSDENVYCIITQALESFDEKKASIILDIDAYSKESFNMEDSEFWNRLERLREIKNEIFFKSIKESTVELFE